MGCQLARRAPTWYRKVEADLGPVDVLVNNAGITRDGFFHKMMRGAMGRGDPRRSQLAVLHDAPGLGGHAHTRLRTHDQHQLDQWPEGPGGQVNYSAAKAGKIGFTKALAQENAKGGITVNVICPGYIDTDMVAAVPEDVLKKIIRYRSRSGASARPRKLPWWCSWRQIRQASLPAQP